MSGYSSEVFFDDVDYRHVSSIYHDNVYCNKEERGLLRVKKFVFQQSLKIKRRRALMQDICRFKIRKTFEKLYEKKNKKRLVRVYHSFT